MLASKMLEANFNFEKWSDKFGITFMVHCYADKKKTINYKTIELNQFIDMLKVMDIPVYSWL